MLYRCMTKLTAEIYSWQEYEEHASHWYVVFHVGNKSIHMIHGKFDTDSEAVKIAKHYYYQNYKGRGDFEFEIEVWWEDKLIDTIKCFDDYPETEKNKYINLDDSKNDLD